jgi:hypothetical protein
MINQQQKDFMEANRPHYQTLIQAEFLTNIGYDVKEGLLNIARIFAPGYQANLWCGPCVCDLVKYAYTQYDKWVAEQVIEEIVEPVIDEPIIKKATFPKHDKPVKKSGRKPKGQ